MIFKKGFTLIELLVVVAIIGILASVVLASLNMVKTKGDIAKMKAQLSNIKSAAELYYIANGNFGNTKSCGEGMFIDSISGMAALTATTNYPPKTFMDCGASGMAWSVAASFPDKTRNIWCVDSTGVFKGAPNNGYFRYRNLVGGYPEYSAHTAQGSTICN